MVEAAGLQEVSVVVDEFFPGPPCASATPVIKPIAATPTSRCFIMVFLRTVDYASGTLACCALAPIPIL
jgi:hypothetical protein